MANITAGERLAYTIVGLAASAAAAAAAFHEYVSLGLSSDAPL